MINKTKKIPLNLIFKGLSIIRKLHSLAILNIYITINFIILV